MKRLFTIVQQIQPRGISPFRLIETNMTSDGPRSRICDGTWETLEEVDIERVKREDTSK